MLTTLRAHTCIDKLTSNLSKAHVTHDSSSPALWCTECNKIILHLEGVFKFEASILDALNLGGRNLVG